MRQLLIAAAIALGATATPSLASEAFQGSAALDKTEAAYARHTREHRMWEIQRNMEMQSRYGRGYYGRGYPHRGYMYEYGYGRRYGGPPPWAPAYGRRYHDRHYDRF